MAGIANRQSLPVLFDQYEMDGAYDEMVDGNGAVRPQYQQLYDALLTLPPEELGRLKQLSDLSFLHQGITFTVYGREEGTERIFPHDLLPRGLESDRSTKEQPWPALLLTVRIPIAYLRC